ncbi:MAG: hypothetical protein IKS67_05935, partial [Victivallales bacterium]|nr:hypothetical protein [Victivallales bacterium]
MKIYKITCGLLVAALWLTAQGQTADELAKGGAAAVKACALKLIDVTERNEKNDTDARVALHGVCVHARYNNIAEAVEQGILEAFAETKKTEVKLYLLEQLYYTAGEKSVAALSPLLTDPQYCHEVYKVLVAIPDAAKVAGPAFLKALPDAKGMCRYEIVQALGELGVAQAAAEVAKDTKSNDRRARLIAYQALARMYSTFSMPSYVAFAEWLPDSAKLPRYERSVIDGALAEFIKNLYGWGRGEEAAKMAEMWMKARPDDITVTCAALEVLDNDEKVVAALLNDDLRVRLSAKRVIEKRTVGTNLVAKALDEKRADKAPLMLELLANSGDSTQLRAVMAVIAWEDEAARAAAIKAAVVLLKGSCLQLLPRCLADERPGVAAAAKAAVASVKAPLADGLAALALQSKGAVQQGVLDVIEKRNDASALPKISALADNGDLEMKQALCRIHGNIGDETSMPFILNQLQKAEDKKTILAAEKGLLTLCRRLGDAKLYLPALKNAFAASKAEAKPSLLKAAALAGTQEALDMEVAAWKNEGDA